jgi:prepilin-type N-terminal cleavage/methylation domain-containing protein
VNAGSCIDSPSRLKELVLYSKNQTGNRAFTLVELLVTISIVAILAAVLFAAVQAAIAQGLKAKCIANLKRDGVAFLSYASDNDGELPPNPDPSVMPVIFWMGEISPYLDLPAAQVPYSGPNALKCPAVSGPEWQTYTLNGNIYSNPQSANFTSSQGVKLSRLKHGDQLVLLFDGADGAVADGYDASDMATYFIVWRHPNNTANFLSVEGSVANYSKTSDITTDDNYWISK